MSLLETATHLLGQQVEYLHPLPGGDLSTVFAARYADGQHIVVKTSPAAHTEAHMLRALRCAGAKTPDVLAHDNAVLILEFCDNQGSIERAWGRLGHMLLALDEEKETPTPVTYGWQKDYAFGALKIINTYSQHWPSFWKANRLLCHAAHVPPALAKRLEDLARRLDDILPAQPPACLLHGDLWGGNIVCGNDGTVTLIDPACYYGDRDVDIAMLELFNTPGEDFWEAYPIRRDTDFYARQAVYQLWPALVHVRLFGSSYLSLVAGLLDRLKV